MLCLFVLCVSFVAPVTAADFPNKPIKMIAHSKPGGGMDIMLRQISNVLEKELPVPLVVENKPGGGSAMAVTAAVTARNPGYTILGVTNTHINTPLVSKTPYSLKNLKPLCFLFTEPLVLVTAADQPWKTAKDFFDAAKNAPGKRSFGASQIGSSEYITAYSYVKQGYPFTIVPFEAGGELITAVMGKHVDVALAEPAEVSALAKAGNIRVLAVFSDSRLPGMPEVATIVEQGYPSAPIVKFRGLMVQENISDEAFNYLYNLFTNMMKTSKPYADFLASNEQIQKIMAPEEFGQFIEKTTQETQEALQALGIAKK